MMTRGSGTVAVLSCLFSLSKPLAEKGKKGPIHFEFHLGKNPWKVLLFLAIAQSGGGGGGEGGRGGENI